MSGPWFAERLVHHYMRVTTVDALGHRVEPAWAYVAVHAIQFMLDSMPRRIGAVRKEWRKKSAGKDKKSLERAKERHLEREQELELARKKAEERRLERGHELELARKKDEEETRLKAMEEAKVVKERRKIEEEKGMNEKNSFGRRNETEEGSQKLWRKRWKMKKREE
ncbi:hypothetical protein TNCV_1327451 [Trichonephila clavipes]|nr:hypothetical protein TNCV_1327451 [Trichonephila clavipes]